MVSVWYPARSPAGRRACYMTPTESELLLRHGGITGLPMDALSTTRTNASIDATPADLPASAPVVVLSPGFTKPRATLTALAEDLASNGYVVAGIEHTHESVATTFPDGRVTTCLAGATRPRDQAFWTKLTAVRTADVSFLLDALTGTDPRPPGARLVDPSRIAMAGHSVGGASTLATMLADPRVRAGIDIDGTTDVTVADSGLSRPFLFLGRRAQYLPGRGAAAATWESDWTRLHGWRRWLVVDGAEHSSFTDVSLLAEHYGLPGRAGLPATRTSQIARTYARAFFDLHLHGTPQPLLDKPSPRFPEVEFCPAGHHDHQATDGPAR